MEEPTTARTGLAILRVWLEEGSSEPKVRLMTIDDVSTGASGAVEWPGASRDTASQQLRSWLQSWAGTAE